MRKKEQRLPNPTQQKEGWFASSCSYHISVTLNDFLHCESLCTQRLCVNLSSLFPYLLTSLPLYLVFSLSRRRRLRRFVTSRLRHTFIIRRRLFQQFLSRFHRRMRALLVASRLIVRNSNRVCLARAFTRHSPLVTHHFLRRRKPLIAPQRLPRQRLELLQARQLLQIAQSKAHQEFLRRLIQNRPTNHFLPPRRGNQMLVQQRADHPRS